MAPIGLRDREAGSVGFTTSLGFGKKLERIAEDPRVALAFHAREHGSATGPYSCLSRAGAGRAGLSPRASARGSVPPSAPGQAARGCFWDRWLHE